MLLLCPSCKFVTLINKWINIIDKQEKKKKSIGESHLKDLLNCFTKDVTEKILRTFWFVPFMRKTQWTDTNKTYECVEFTLDVPVNVMYEYPSLVFLMNYTLHKLCAYDHVRTLCALYPSFYIPHRFILHIHPSLHTSHSMRESTLDKWKQH